MSPCDNRDTIVDCCTLRGGREIVAAVTIFDNRPQNYVTIEYYLLAVGRGVIHALLIIMNIYKWRIAQSLMRYAKRHLNGSTAHG